MKKVFSLVLIFAAALTVCGCGSAQSTQKGPEGDWTSKAIRGDSLLEAVLEGDAETRGVAAYMELKSFTVTFNLTLSSDGSFRLMPDRELLNASVNDLLESFDKNSDAFLNAEIAAVLPDTGVSEREFRVQHGLAPDAPLLPAMGLNKSELLADLDLKGRLMAVTELWTVRGTYSCKGNVLRLTSDDGVVLGEYSGKTGTVILTSGKDAADFGLYPMVFFAA